MDTAGTYEYMSDLAYFNTCHPSSPCELPPKMREIVTPLVWEAWDRELASHPDQNFRQYIVDRIRYGFRIGFEYRQAACRKSQGTTQVVRDYLAEECSEGRILGPLNPASFPFVHTSCFGVIPKSTPGKWRLMVDLSLPAGQSVNDGIQESRCSLLYVGVDGRLERYLPRDGVP